MRRNPRPLGDTVELACGAGGGAMRALVEQLLADGLGAVAPGEIGLAAMDDGAALRLGDRWLVVTTDSHVVQPLEFPGGDIGRLAIAGTVNDLAVMGATRPLALTLSAIIEEGFPRATLERIWQSIRGTCAEAGTTVVTGDTKVMRRGEVDGLVLSTTGVALADRVVGDAGLRPGDRILVTGTVGDHGLAVMATRLELALETALVSDVAPIGGLIAALLEAGGDEVVALKDPTRGGLSSALHEMADKSGVGVVLDEPAVPVRREARAVAELLGIDPLLVACEGRAVVGVRPGRAAAVLDAARAHPLGRDAAIVGTCVTERPGAIVVDTGFGRRLLAEIDGALLPRIC